jgi:hypothetical protein
VQQPPGEDTAPTGDVLKLGYVHAVTAT